MSDSKSFIGFDKSLDNDDSSRDDSQVKRTVIVMLIIFIFIILPLAVIISQSLRMVNLNYQLERLENSLSQVQEENRELERQVAEMKRLDRIERIARDDLNMVEAEQTHRLALNGGIESRQEQAASIQDQSNSWLNNIWNGFRRAAAAPLE